LFRPKHRLWHNDGMSPTDHAKLKLAIVRQRYNPFGGAERFVERALGALGDNGLHVSLITREWKGGGEGRDIRLCNPFHLGRLWRDAGFSQAVRKLIAKGEFDLVQSHERIPGCSVYRAGDGVHATWLALRARQQSPLSRWFTELHPWHRYTLAAEEAMFRHPSLRAVICNSVMVRDDIAQRFGVPQDELHVIHNGVDLDYFNPLLKPQYRADMRTRLGIDDATPVILYVGSGFARKGVPQLLQALTEMHHQNAVAIVVGKDKHSRRMQALAASLGLGGRVHFAGPQQDVRPWYGMADVLGLPTLYDPFPNVALEALACGLPVMTTSTCGAAEVLQGRDCGRICDALDTTAQAIALDALLAGDARQLAVDARDCVSGLGREDMARRLQALYAQLLRGAG
jgi:UDP-glucose:(heptosyl)LPS alpha-1,3-glucosyltransferase